MSDHPEKPRRRRYTLTERARRQRQAAPWKHGQRAEGIIEQAVPPCKKGTCPAEYPCDIKRQADEKGAALTACPVHLVRSPELTRAYKQAIQDGDRTALTEVAAMALGSMADFFLGELEQLRGEGLVTEQELFSSEGDLIGSKQVQNPRADPLFKLASLTGFTADQQATTPKGSKEARRDDEIGSFLSAVAGNLGRLHQGDST